MSSGSAGGGRVDDGAGAVSSSSSSSPAAAALLIPAGSRKIVQNLKEIVNRPEAEIYSMLKECNMDPSEAVNRLLNQDTFQEVKSKRDKKKEAKDISESKIRGMNSTINRGGRASNDRASRVGSNNSSSFDYGGTRSKPFLKKDNVTNAAPNPSILGSAVSGNAISMETFSSSNPASADASGHVSATDGISLSSNPSMGCQHAWSGVPGQVSMADIVRMGRPHSKFSNKPVSATEIPSTMGDPVATNDYQVNTKHEPSMVLPSESTQEWQSSQDNVLNISEAIYDPNASIIERPMSRDELVNQLPGKNRSTIYVTSSSAAVSVEPSRPSNLHDGVLNLNVGSHMDGNHMSASTNFESLPTDSRRPDVSCDEQLEVPDAAGRPSRGNASFEGLHPFERHAFEHHEAEVTELSTVATNLQHLSVKREAHEGQRPDDHPAVIFPEHLQVTSADCSHLSFGSFGSGGATLPGSHVQETLPSNLEQPSTTPDLSSFCHVDARNTELYNDEQIKPASEENITSRDSASLENYEQSSSSQLTAAETDATHSANELKYNMPSLLPSHNEFSSATQPIATDFNYGNTHSQGEGLASISSMAQAYVNSLQSNILSPANQPGREFDPPYLPMLSSQPLPTRYNTVMSSVSQPAISMTETLKSSLFSGLQSPQPTSQGLESTSIPAGSGLPQHLPVHPYSQPPLPLGPFAANMISYPFLHPSYTYMPSAFQPTYTSSGAYHQSPAAAQGAGVKYTLPPQYKNNLSLNSLPQSTAIPSGYGGFGSSANVPGSFVANPPSVPANAANFEDALGSQYKESNLHASLQQGGGGGSRAISGLPANAYYGLQDQSQHVGFRQAKQQASHYGNLGYTNLYRSQVGASQDSHHQNPGVVADLSNSQGLPSQTSHHLWPVQRH